MLIPYKFSRQGSRRELEEIFQREMQQERRAALDGWDELSRG
ncbi:hypothetical protein ACLB1M_26430 [Escherichia coli]